MDGGVGHTAWAPEGREGRSQAGPKGRQLEVGPRRGPRLLVHIYIYIYGLCQQCTLCLWGKYNVVYKHVSVIQIQYDIHIYIYMGCASTTHCVCEANTIWYTNMLTDWRIWTVVMILHMSFHFVQHIIQKAVQLYFCVVPLIQNTITRVHCIIFNCDYPAY